MKIKEAETNITHHLRRAGALVIGFGAGLCLMTGEEARGQVSDSETILSKGLTFLQTSAAAPGQASRNAAVFEADIPGLGGPSGGLGAHGSMVLPGGATVALPYDDADSVFLLDATNDTPAGLDASYPAGHYSLLLTSDFLSTTNEVDLPADAFPPAPQFSNYAAAQQIDASHDFALEFGAFAGAADPDDSTLEIYDSTGSLVVSDTPDLGASSYTISSDTLASGQTYSVHLRFRRLTVVQETFFPSAFGFYSETVMNVTTAGGNTGTTAPTLTSSFPAGGETIVSGAPFVLQFSEAMNQTVSIQWSESINGVNVPLSFNPFTYLWTDSQTLACLYGGIGGTWPAGAVFSWTLNPVPGAATNFSSTGGVALASGVYSGSFLTPGGPWQCAAQVTNSLEAPGFYLVKAANYLQSPDSAPVPDVSLGAQFLAYLQTPDNGALADPPLVIVVPPTVAVGSYGGVELSLSETSAALLAGQFVFSSATSANGATGLDNAFPAGNYILEIAPQNPSSPTAVPVPTNAVTLALSGGSYPPVPQLVSSGVIPVNTITNGLTVSWLPWTGATTNSFVSFQILDGATNVVFSAPNSCSNLALAASASSIAIPSNTLSAGVPYQIALSFMSISDSNKYLTNIPGLGYGALASVTRMSLLAYMSPPPSVAILSPGAGAFVSSGVVAVQVEASQPHAFLTELQLFSGTNLIATQTLGSGKTMFSGAISGSIPPGPQSLYVVATDSNGQTTTAGPVAIMAQSPSFVVTMSEPVNGASYPPFATVALAGGASSPNGAITNVDLFMDGNLIGSVAGAPFNFPVSQVYPGAHQFYVHAFDSAGFGGASTPVSITVAAPPKYDLTPFLSTNGSFSFGFSGDPATGYVLEAATNLTPPVNWVPVQSKLLSGAQGVFSDAGYAAYTTRYYRIAPINASLSNQPAFSVWGQSDPTVTASDDYEVSEGALVAMTNAGGAVLNLTLPPGALELGQPVTLVSVTNLEDYPFAGPLVAAAEVSPSEVDLFETGTLMIQPPTNVSVGSLVAFTYHVPNGELFLTPFTVTNLVTGTTTNPAIAIPINRMGGYGVAALTSADLNLAGHFLPSDSSDSLDQATALYLLSPSSGVRLGNVGSLGGLRGGAGQPGGPHGPGAGGPVAMDHTQLVQQFLDQFDVIYAQMQAAEAASELNLCQYMTWAQWLEGPLRRSGLADEFSIQIAEFAQALDSIYQVAITKLIQKADSEHDWSSIVKLVNIDLSGKLNKGIIAQGWQPGQEEALQQALDDCLTFEFDLDSSFANDSDIGTETSRLTAAVSFQEGNPANSHKVKGSAAVQWKTTDFPPIPPCSEPTASPSTPDVLFFAFNPKGTSTKNANCSTTYTTTGLLTIFWPGIPEENFTTTCKGYPVQLADYWWPEFGVIYDNDLQAYPKHNGPPQASFYVDDSWQMGGGGGNPTLATRQGSAVYKLKDGTITETSTWMLKHTPQ